MEKITINNKEYYLDAARAQELGILKIIDNLPKSWEEYCARTIPEPKYNKFEGKEGSAFAALGKLIHLRDAWRGNWEPNWNDATQSKYCILFNRGEMYINEFTTSQLILAFPTKEMCKEFSECFKCLIKQAKMFL